MDNNNPNQGSIFNVGDLAKPVDTLIQRTSDFLGAALAPRQLIRLAKAKVEADRIEKLGNVETEIRERALKRLLAEEIRNQENIENIVRLALPEVKEDAKPEEISDDWLALFFNKSKQFSDNEMQDLWAKILAGEANKAGTFSRRTIEIISTLEQSDAELFTKLCSFCFEIEEKKRLLIYFSSIVTSSSIPLIEIYKKNDIDGYNLHHLQTIGLISFNKDDSYLLSSLPDCPEIGYFENRINLDLVNEPDNKGYLSIGNVFLTKSGEELAAICCGEMIDGFWELVMDKWKMLGYNPKAKN